jgi:hypothetical protein
MGLEHGAELTLPSSHFTNNQKGTSFKNDFATLLFFFSFREEYIVLTSKTTYIINKMQSK